MAEDIRICHEAVLKLLKDQAQGTWSSDDVDAAIRLALAEISRRIPQRRATDVTLPLGGREVPLSGIAQCLRVEETWWPYEGCAYPPNRAAFERVNGSLLLHTINEPAPGEMVHIIYVAMHTISGLDGATSTSLPPQCRGLLTIGAAGYLAMSQAAVSAKKSDWPETALRNWGQALLTLFQARLPAKVNVATEPWGSCG